MKIIYNNYLLLILEKNNNEMVINDSNKSFEDIDRKDLLKMKQNR